MMKKILVLLIAAVVFVSCGDDSYSKKGSEKENVTAGTEVAAELTPDNFLDKAEELVEKEIVIIGTVDHTCKHGGKKMVIYGEDPDNMVKIFAAGDIDKFDVELEGDKVKVKGIVKEMRIDEDFLNDWEKEARDHHGENADELAEELKKIDAYRQKIKESEKGYLSNFSIDGYSYEVLKEGEAEHKEEGNHEEGEDHEEGHEH